MNVEVYTDGSGTTGGPAGIGYVWSSDTGLEGEGSLPLKNATNQQAEILAAALALHDLPIGCTVRIVSDSEYLVLGWNERLAWWRANEWRKKTGGIVANIAHWQRLIQAADKHVSVVFEWTQGHAGIEGNERADALAKAARLIAKQEAQAA